MKKILIILMLIISVPMSAADDFNFSDTLGGGAEDNSAVGAGLQQAGTNPGDINQSGNSYGSFNQSGTNPGDINQSGTNPGDFNNYDPAVDPKFYGEQAPAGESPFSASSNRNPFTSKQDGIPKLSLMGIVGWLVGIMNQLVYVIIGASLVSFLYGILKLSFIDGHKPEAREQARKFMFWGIVSLFVMMSVWGLVRIFQFTLFGNGPLIIPQLK